MGPTPEGLASSKKGDLTPWHAAAGSDPVITTSVSTRVSGRGATRVAGGFVAKTPRVPVRSISESTDLCSISVLFPAFANPWFRLFLAVPVCAPTEGFPRLIAQ